MHGDVAVGCDTPTNASSVGARCIPFEVHAAKLADTFDGYISQEQYCNRLNTHCTSNKLTLCSAQAPSCFDQCAALTPAR